VAEEHWTNEVGQVKKRCGVTPSGGDTRVEANKTYSDEQKRAPVFQEKINTGDNVEVTDGDD